MKATRYDYGLLVLRLGLGLTLLYYGCQKSFGWFGGLGYIAQLDVYRSIGFQTWVGNLAIAAELLGGLLILIGLATQMSAFGAGAVMVMAVIQIVRTPDIGTAVFRTGDPLQASRFFLSPMLLVCALALLIMGAGKFSFDARLFGGKKAK